MGRMLSGSAVWRMLCAVGAFFSAAFRGSRLNQAVGCAWKNSALRGWFRRRLDAQDGCVQSSRTTRLLQSLNGWLSRRFRLKDTWSASCLHRCFFRDRLLRPGKPSARLAVPARRDGTASDAARRLRSDRLYAAGASDRAAALLRLGRAADPFRALLDLLGTDGSKGACPDACKSPRPAGLRVFLRRSRADVRRRELSVHSAGRLPRDGAVYSLVLSCHAAPA